MIRPAASAVLPTLSMDVDEALRRIVEVNPGARPF